MKEKEIAAMIEFLHVKTNVAVSMINLSLNILKEANLKPSGKARLEREMERLNESIGKASAAFEQSMNSDRGWWVTNRDTTPENKRVSGPYTTSADAGRAREIIERFKPNITYWIEELET